jgi:ABC-type bacteriocin/lantibiotic exporter with double-glycine peptidase domain
VLPSTMHRLPEKLVVVSILISILEFLGLASILPIINVLVNESVIENNKYLSVVYNYFGFQSSVEFCLAMMGGVVLIFLIKGGFAFLALRYQIKWSFRAANEVALNRFASYLSQPYDFHVHTDTSLMVRNSQHIPFKFANSILIPFITLVNNLFLAILVVTGMLLYNATLFLSVVVLLAPAFYLYNRVTKRTLQNIREKLNTGSWKLRQTSYQSFTTYKDIRLFQKEPFFVNWFRHNLNKFVQASQKLRILNTFIPKIFEVLVVVSIFVIMLVGMLATASITTLGQFLSVFAIGIYKLIPSATRFISFSNNIKANYYVFDYLESMNLPVNERALAQPKERLPFRKSIRLKGISFQYEPAGPPILDEVDLTINKGETVGVMGPTGSGKTTLMNILLRMYTEDEGQVLVDGTPLTEENYGKWYNIISYVPQEVNVLHGSFTDNIAFGVPTDQIDEERVKQAAQQAQLYEFIQSCPDQFNTRLGNRGLSISGGNDSGWRSPGRFIKMPKCCSLMRPPVSWIWKPNKW